MGKGTEPFGYICSRQAGRARGCRGSGVGLCGSSGLISWCGGGSRSVCRSLRHVRMIRELCPWLIVDGAMPTERWKLWKFLFTAKGFGGGLVVVLEDLDFYFKLFL